MADRPILFSAPMVRALLAGTKTQTRRALNPQPQEDIGIHLAERPVRFSVGDRLWVRESWRTDPYFDSVAPRDIDAGRPLRPEADGDANEKLPSMLWGKLRPGMFMPRWASRLTLIVTDVRVERLQDISEEDALAEGIVRLDATKEDLEWERSFAEEQGRKPEGVDPVWLAPGTRQGFGPRPNDPSWGPTPQFAYRLLWNSINGSGGWESNPWVVAVTFTVERRNIDAGA